MAKGAAFVSLDAYKLTGVQVTDRKLGVGSGAVVIELDYMGHKCAGKKIHDVLLKSGGEDYRIATHSFSKECHFLSRIQHPNIVQFLGVYFQEPAGEIPILVMEFLPCDLTSCIQKHGVLPRQICYSILLDIAQGLLYLHDRTSPLIHRDLSSNNILLSPVLMAKIADLGVARIVNMSPLQVSALTQNPGTLIYMPPEVMVDNPHYNTGIDVFSYGILMIQIFCGKSPRPHVPATQTSEYGTLFAVSEAERRKNYLQIVGYDHPLMNLIHNCIDNNPKLRPSAKGIVQQLKENVESATPSFKEKVEIMKFVADEEAKNRNDKPKSPIRQWGGTRSYTAGTIFVAMLAIFIAAILQIAFNKPIRFGNQAQYFVNSTIAECTMQEKISCDKLIPSMIHNLIGNISWKSGKALQTTLYKGQSVVINDKVYYGGGLADDDVHKYYVYCYDPQLNDWTSSVSLPVKSFGLGKFDGKLVAVGGITMSGEESKKVYTYNEITDTWMPGEIPDMPTSRIFPAVLSLSSGLVIAGGEQSIAIYTRNIGWYWSNQPLSVPCTDVTLVVAGDIGYVLAGNYTKELLVSDWFPLSMYISIDDLLYNRNKVVPGRAFENRNDLIYPSYRWRNLPGGFSTQANSLVGTTFTRNLITLGVRSQQWNRAVRMYSLTEMSWIQIGELPSELNIASATIASLSSTTDFFVTGKEQDTKSLSVYIGSLQLL